MINKLYSLLVSGADAIPQDWAYYRKYYEVECDASGMLKDNDPYLRSMWANYIIELARLSPLYAEVNKLDRRNTYNKTPRGAKYVCHSNGCIIIDHSPTYPVLKDKFTVNSDGNDLYASPEGHPDKLIMLVDGKINYNGNIIHIGHPEKLPYSCSVEIVHKSVILPIPTNSQVNSLLSYIPKDIQAEMDMDSTYDRAAAFCIALLNKYKGY